MKQIHTYLMGVATGILLGILFAELMSVRFPHIWWHDSTWYIRQYYDETPSLWDVP